MEVVGIGPRNIRKIPENKKSDTTVIAKGKSKK